MVICTRVDVVPVPHRLEQRVAEAQVEDLLEPHLPEVVVDAQQLRLVDVLVQLVGERARRRLVVPERLLHDDARVLGQTGARQSLDDHPEQRRRDLQVEHRLLLALDRLADALVRGVVGEVARHVRHALGQAGEDLLVELLTGGDDRRARPVDELVVGPVVDGDADDRAVEQLALLEPVQRPEGHDLRQVAGDPEDHEHVTGHGFLPAQVRARHSLSCPRRSRRGHA